MAVPNLQKAAIYTRYPWSHILLYNGVTILHFLLGGVGIILGYESVWWGGALGIVYLVFAFGQMYVLMPRMVCKNCTYYWMDNARCISGKNLLARRISGPGDPRDFGNRAQGLLCHNNLYMTALFAPVLLILPTLVFNFSPLVLAILLGVVGLLLFRIFVIFTQVACLHCSAKYECPNAARTGVRDR